MELGSPRDAQRWMQSVERRLSEGPRSAMSAMAQTVGTVVDNSMRVPAAPVEITFDTSIYIDTRGRTRVRVIIDFPDVTVGNDAVDMTMSRYELWGQDETPPLINSLTVDVPGLAVPGNSVTNYADPYPASPTFGPMVELQTTGESTFRVENFVPGSLWRLRMRAVGTNGTPGDFSADIMVQMVSNDGAPPMTSAPTLRIERGTITALWDGKSVAGASMPADFRYAVLSYGKAPQPVTEVARFGRNGGFYVVADLPYYEPQHFRLKAVDEGGNESPWSAEAVGNTQPLVDTDIILSTIDGAVTALKNIDASASVLTSTVLARHIVASEDLTAKIAQFLVVDAGMVNANSIWADEIWVGLADAVLVRADMFVGKEFDGGTFTGTTFQTDAGEYEGVIMDELGIRGYTIGGLISFNLDRNTGDVTATGMFQTSVTGRRVKMWDHGYGETDNIASIDLFPDLTDQHGALYTEVVGTAYTTNLRHFTDGSTNPSYMTLDSNGNIQLGSSGGTSMAINGDGSAYLHASKAQVNLNTDGSASFSGQNSAQVYLYANGEAALIGKSGNLDIGASGGGIGILHNNGAFVNVYNNKDVLMQSDTNHYVYVTNSAAVYINGGLSVSGTKNFVMDHPTKPGMELLHASTESPVSGIEYWGTETLDASGSATVTLPDYFEALAKPDGRVNLVWANGVALEWTAIASGAFTVTGPAGTSFSWLVKAERYGGDFEVERTKVTPPVPMTPDAPPAPSPPSPSPAPTNYAIPPSKEQPMLAAPRPQ